ncbi:sugar phosphate nucleotidyltransferase [Sporosarcina sp. E16_8]|uniref:sugar phosphate nucleotidyltransferase n=1 Tax=Sporosarcina sp. E16_8 TaxID=2789295 RepID=UPI001A90D689|nr:sugar phosphate nucleotidyltransferase [Sporosarcina sp. E16_8]MBO0589177.1 cupin domain-containing protein [Sporosarcina sp. E16_8]
MRLILLSGGSGKRLWPLSNDARSKQFLKVLPGENDKLVSMVQRVWGQLGDVGLQDSTVISTSKAQVDMINSQLDESVDLVVEPSRRDTFPAIALAAAYLHTVKKADLDEMVAVLPVDPFVEDSFFERVKDLEDSVNQSNADIALIGVEPSFPSEKYGYIVPKEKGKLIHEVERFTEKPSGKIAESLMADGALWNCGVFAFKLSYILNLLKDKGFTTDYYGLLLQYEKLPKISFDYEVVEKAKKIVAISYEGYWKDLGTWNTLTEEMATSKIGKSMVCEESLGTHVINELDLPVTVLGIKDAIIAVSPDGILVSSKEKSPKIKEYIDSYDDRPMFEERRWGWYRVLDYVRFEEGNEVLTKRIGVNAGANLSYQYHHERSEVWTIVKGEGVFAYNGDLRTVKPGDVLQISVGDRHGIKAITDMEFVEVQTGSQLIEEDIVRLYMTWEEVEDHCTPIQV